jgi:hypothetical protein
MPIGNFNRFFSINIRITEFAATKIVILMKDLFHFRKILLLGIFFCGCHLEKTSIGDRTSSDPSAKELNLSLGAHDCILNG